MVSTIDQLWSPPSWNWWNEEKGKEKRSVTTPLGKVLREWKTLMGKCQKPKHAQLAVNECTRSLGYSIGTISVTGGVWEENWDGAVVPGLAWPCVTNMGSAAETVAACQRKISDFSCTQLKPKCKIEYVETYRLSDQNFIGGKKWSKIYYNKITSVKYKIKKFSGWTLVKTGLTPCFPIRGQTGIHSFLFQKQDHLRMNKSTGSNNHLRKGFP